MPQIDAYLKKLDEVGGSDLHLTSGVPPKVRVHGRLRTLSDKPMDPGALGSIIDEILNPERRKVYAEKHDLEASLRSFGAVGLSCVSCHEARDVRLPAK